MRPLIRIILITISILYAVPFFAQYSGGSGTDSDPYHIGSLDDLKMLSDSSSDWNKYFELTQDIDASPTLNWNNGKGFGMIGINYTAFSGGFDGNGHKISNLYINRSGESNVGMFGTSAGGYIRNLELEHCSVKGSSAVGSLVGKMGWFESGITEISNIILSGCKVQGGLELGGLVGQIMRGRIENCILNDTLRGGISYIGGLAGITYFDEESWIRNCSVTTSIAGRGWIGGLVGVNRLPVSDCKATISLVQTQSAYSCIGGFTGANYLYMLRCSVSGEIQMKWYNVTQLGGFAGLNSSDIMDCSTSVAIESTNGMYVGGFVGENDGHIKSCYATGDVTGNTFTGGFAGFSTEGSTLANCYAIGTTTGNDRTGGFIGENSYFATCTNCYSCGKVNSDAWFSGGFAGLNRSTAHTLFCFYDRATSLKNPGIGMDHNGQNMDPVSLPTAGFAGEQVFLDAGWGFGNTIVQPWQMGMAPDGFFRPVFYSQQYPVTFQADTGGFVEPDSLLTQFIFLGQNSRSVRAVPSPKHKFLAWYSPAGDSLTNTNPLIVSDIRSDTLVIARFVYYDAIEELPSVKWIVYPNPATASLNIEWDPIIYPGDRCYTLTDIRGREVIRRNSDSNSITLDVSILDPGVYMLGVLSGKTRLYRKIAIQ